MKKSLFVLAALLVMSSFASAATSYVWDSGSGMYNSGNQIQGLAVNYDQVASDTGLYGNMQVNGDAMWFFPTQFQLESENGAPDPVSGFNLDETLQFDLAVKPGGAENRVIDSISFIEYGDYGLIDSLGSGTDLTNATVTGTVFINILQTQTGPYFGAPIFETMTFTPSEGDYYLDADGAINQKAWSGGINVSLAGLGVTEVHISIDNQLTVASEDGTIARIEKKGLGENPAVSISPVIPEPATLALLGLGGLMLRRRK